jgi:hypothetical protein
MFSHVEEALRRLRGTFRDHPDLALTVESACQLTGLDELTCYNLLMALEHTRFLLRSHAGAFLLRADPAADDGHFD